MIVATDLRLHRPSSKYEADLLDGAHSALVRHKADIVFFVLPSRLSQTVWLQDEEPDYQPMPTYSVERRPFGKAQAPDGAWYDVFEVRLGRKAVAYVCPVAGSIIVIQPALPMENK